MTEIYIYTYIYTCSLLRLFCFHFFIGVSFSFVFVVSFAHFSFVSRWVFFSSFLFDLFSFDRFCLFLAVVVHRFVSFLLCFMYCFICFHFRIGLIRFIDLVWRCNLFSLFHSVHNSLYLCIGDLVLILMTECEWCLNLSNHSTEDTLQRDLGGYPGGAL